MAKVRIGKPLSEEPDKSEYESWVPGTYQKKIPLGELHEHPDNWDLVGRIEAAKKGALAEDIKKAGIREPLQVWLHDGRLVVVSGHERLNIARELGIAELPCVKVDFKSELEARQHIFATNANRKTVKRPATEIMEELFPPEEYPLLYADLRGNYGESDSEGNAFPLPDESSGSERNAFLSEDKSVEELRREQEALRKKAAKTVGLTEQSARKTINKVAANAKKARKTKGKTRILTPLEEKRKEGLEKKIESVTARIEKKETQLSDLKKELSELRKEERSLSRDLERLTGGAS